MTRSVLITGCATGIGHAAAHYLHQQGFNVIASARNEQDVAQLRQQGLKAVHLDLADEASIERGLEQALTLTDGQLYGLFNNGAYGQPGALEDVPTAAAAPCPDQSKAQNPLSGHPSRRDAGLAAPAAERPGPGSADAKSRRLTHDRSPDTLL